MKREDVQKVLNEPGAQKLLQASFPLRLGYTGLDGLPRVIPIGFHWDGTHIFVCTAPSAPKVKALEKNPGVAMTIDTNEFPPHVLLIRGTASMEIVDGVPQEFLDGARKAVPPQMWDDWESGVRGLYKQMARITIVPGWAKFMDFETSAPDFVEKLAQEAEMPTPAESAKSGAGR